MVWLVPVAVIPTHAIVIPRKIATRKISIFLDR